MLSTLYAIARPSACDLSIDTKMTLDDLELP